MTKYDWFHVYNHYCYVSVITYIKSQYFSKYIYHYQWCIHPHECGVLYLIKHHIHADGYIRVIWNLEKLKKSINATCHFWVHILYVCKLKLVDLFYYGGRWEKRKEKEPRNDLQTLHKKYEFIMNLVLCNIVLFFLLNTNCILMYIEGCAVMAQP